MEMLRFNNADKSGRNHRIGLAKKLAGILLAGVMMATNFAGVGPGVAHAATVVNDEAALFFGSGDQRSAHSGDYQLNTVLLFQTPIVLSFNHSTTVDLNGYAIVADAVNVYDSISVMDNSTSANGHLLYLYMNENSSLNVSSGEVIVAENNGNIYISGGAVKIYNNLSGGTITQTGGSVEFAGSNNGTYIQTGGTNSNNKEITLNPNGGTLTTSSLVTTFTTSDGEKLNTLPAAPTGPATTPYFAGWFTATDGGDLVTTDTVFANNTIIYAHWTNVPPYFNPADTDALTAENPSVDSTKDYLDELTEKLEEAINSGGPQTIYWHEGTALPGPVMKLLQENPQITLVFSYTYEGLDYVVTLPGKYVKYDPNVPWCGPLYLYGLYGKYGTTTAPVATTTQTGERTYTVISGETLWGIAMRLGTTVEELVRLNNITNPDRIDIGQIIRY